MDGLTVAVGELFPLQAANTATPTAMAEGLMNLNMPISLLPQKRNNDSALAFSVLVMSRYPPARAGFYASATT
jgi:hypothetical protein